MERGWLALVICTGCLHPNPKFMPGAAGDTDDTAGDGDGTGGGTGGGSGSTSGPAMTSGTASGGGTLGDTDVGASTTVGVDDEPGSDDDPTNASMTTGAAQEHEIFLSSAFVTGSYGALTAHDAFCQQLADAAGRGGTWMAVISSTAENARDRISITGPIYNVMGELIANDEADFWDGSIATPIRYTELGIELLHTPWTGTQPDGVLAAEHCQNWSGGGGQAGAIGYAGYSDFGWIEFDTAPCAQTFPIYCISQ